ncbi:hypothetical protein [Alkalihalobacillus sp. CinArs1]|uniref:hypothetical protein n=1 Tax=Alkalihalobacillus sp. CinArs1 TaxID=2995314 RepID=UPI0022DD10A8|nr:hypothetical protein [Alkalihalobacillus sp. CinArs1]
MNQLFLVLFIIGTLLVILAWYRGRGEGNKQYTWLSYLSLAVPVIIILLVYIIPKGSMVTIYLTPIGSLIAFILIGITLFKRNEKNLLAAIGLFLSLLLLGILIIFGIFIITPLEP